MSVARSAATASLIAAVPLALAAPAVAAPAPAQFTVTAEGGRVELRTASCPDGGVGKLVANGRANPVQGRTVGLADEGALRSASWPGLDAGVYTVSVLCRDGSSPGSRTVAVRSGTAGAAATPALVAAPATSPAISATSAPRPDSSRSPVEVGPVTPSRGVQGGVGGTIGGRTATAVAAGTVLVVIAAGAGAWQLRRRTGARH